jgi:hypothetical protein
MPRKSQALRLSQATNLTEAFAEANMGDDYRARFAQDMVTRLGRNKGLSKRQRDWLDSLIEEGVPVPKGDFKLLARIKAAQNTEGVVPRDVNILGEFAGKLARGWVLSEKQEEWMLGILENAERIAIEGPWEPSVEQIIKLEACVKLANGYSQMHWGNHPGTHKALRAVSEYLAHSGTIDEWHVNKLIKSMTGKLKELFEKPYVTSEKPCWAMYGSKYANAARSWGLATVMGAPSVNDRGQIVYPVLMCSGALELVTRQRLSKRKPR